MRSLNLVLLFLATSVTGFSFTGVPATVSANTAASATLIRDSNDPTSFSLLLRLTTQNGGTTIKTFTSEDSTSIPFTFTPTGTGTFLIEVISNLQPISDTEQPSQIFASSSSIAVTASEVVSVPSSTSSSDSAVTLQSTTVQTTTDNNNGKTSSTTVSVSSTSPVPPNTIGSTTTAEGTTADGTFLTATNPAATQSSSSSGAAQGGSFSQSSSSSLPTVTSGSSVSSASGSDSSSSGSSPTSTSSSSSTLAPSSASAKSNKTGTILGILFGVLGFIAICLVFLVLFMRRRRRKRTSAFERKLMFVQARSSPITFNTVTPPPSTTNEGMGDGGSGYREYVPESDIGDAEMMESGMSRPQSFFVPGSENGAMETGSVAQSDQRSWVSQPFVLADISDIIEESAGVTPSRTDLSHPQSVYSEQSIYSDSPSVFYTAVPTTQQNLGTSVMAGLPPSTLPLLTAPSISVNSSYPTPPGSTLTATSFPAAVPPDTSLPRLAPGWVFPREQPRRSQLLPPRTDRQMDIYNRKIRLQGQLLGMQGWGNEGASESQKAEIQMMKDQIRRLDILENSDWALGKSNDLPAMS